MNRNKQQLIKYQSLISNIMRHELDDNHPAVKHAYDSFYANLKYFAGKYLPSKGNRQYSMSIRESVSHANFRIPMSNEFAKYIIQEVGKKMGDGHFIPSNLWVSMDNKYGYLRQWMERLFLRLMWAKYREQIERELLKDNRY